MKKILFALVALMCSMSMNAQVMTIMKDGEVVKSYTSTEANSVVFEETPSVIKVTDITLNATEKTLYLGLGDEWATVTLGGTVSPENATDLSIVWSTDNAEVATVSETGVVTAVGEGTATITATANDGSGVSASCTITVVKIVWKSIGMGEMYDDFILEKSVPVEILQRQDYPYVFRIMNPFGSIEEQLDGNQSEFIAVRILQKGDVWRVNITKPGIVGFDPFNTGFVHPTYQQDIMGYHPSVFAKYGSEDDYLHNRVLSYQANGLPGQIQLAPYFYLEGVGGWDKTQQDKQIVITFPGYTPEFQADIQKNFSYSDVFTGSFTSELLGTSTTATLQVGKCDITTDDCDKRFEEQYGTVYQIADAYATDHNLIFLVKDNKIALPTSTLENDYELQATGIKALGKDVFAKINPAASTFSENKIELNITFMDKFGKEFYTTTETLANSAWRVLGKGYMIDDMIVTLFSGMDPVTYNVVYEESVANPGLIRVVNPFGPNDYPYYDALVDYGFQMPSEGQTLIINCEDPDAVYIEHQDLEMDLGDGPVGFASYGAYLLENGKSFEAIKADGLFGKYDKTTGKITFPSADNGNGKTYQGLIYENNKPAYIAGVNGAIEFQLPTGEASTRRMVSAPAVSSKKLQLQAEKIKVDSFSISEKF